MHHEELWRSALGEIELSLSKANFITWFKNTSIVSNENGRVVVGVPNGFSKEWLENKYRPYILRALGNFDQSVKEISCVIHSPQENTSNKPTKSVDALKNPYPFKKNIDANKDHSSFLLRKNFLSSNINPRYTFDNYIVGENNALAQAACYTVSQNIGQTYNPLFIYGGVGLGKTHLLQAIGNEVLRKNPSKNIRYISSERFATNLIESIKNQKVAQFKDEYQKCDLLIIDDIQFLSGKEKTQHEFFHIFNTLYQINKQIVLSSDRPPKSISSLEERLRSRFEGGMIVDVIQPDLETRMAILKAKATEKEFFIEDDSVKFIAENIKHNIRELEGALNKLIASCDLLHENPTIDFTKKILSEIISSGKRKGVRSEDIISAISDFYSISRDDLINKGRKKEVSLARQTAMYIMRSELNVSYPHIGKQFGGRDHTTAIHAFEKISKELGSNPKLSEDIAIIKEKLYTIL